MFTCQFFGCLFLWTLLLSKDCSGGTGSFRCVVEDMLTAEIQSENWSNERKLAFISSMGEIQVNHGLPYLALLKFRQFTCFDVLLDVVFVFNLEPISCCCHFVRELSISNPGCQSQFIPKITELVWNDARSPDISWDLWFRDLRFLWFAGSSVACSHWWSVVNVNAFVHAP